MVLLGTAFICEKGLPPDPEFDSGTQNEPRGEGLRYADALSCRVGGEVREMCRVGNSQLTRMHITTEPDPNCPTVSRNPEIRGPGTEDRAG